MAQRTYCDVCGIEVKNGRVIDLGLDLPQRAPIEREVCSSECALEVIDLMVDAIEARSTAA